MAFFSHDSFVNVMFHINISLNERNNRSINFRKSEILKGNEFIMSVKERLTIRKRGQITFPKSFIETFD